MQEESVKRILSEVPVEIDGQGREHLATRTVGTHGEQPAPGARVTVADRDAGAGPPGHRPEQG